MNLETASRLERHIQNDVPASKPQATRIGNGEWIIKLANGMIVWSIEDWNTNFVAQPEPPVETRSEVQEMSA